MNPILHLHGTIGNKAVRRKLQTDAKELEAELTETASPWFSYDFSRIPIYPPVEGTRQTKLTIDELGDSYEQEAGRIAEQVIRTPEAQLQPNCLCGGGCPRCQAEQPGKRRESVHTNGVQAGSSGQIAAQPILHEVLGSPGQPLDPATRGFMESRFGHDFSQVRVHTDHLAAQSAEAMAAQAYTVGANVVFAMGRYAPAGRDGRRLLAHELTHVVQQTSSYSAQRIVQRSPDNKPMDSGTGVPEGLLLHSTAYWPKPLNSEHKVRMLGANPDHADLSWKMLTPAERLGVEWNMARFHGVAFARQFVEIHNAAKRPKPFFEQVGSDTTPAQLTARGFHLAGTQAQIDVEVWFHPSGSRIHRLEPSEPAKKRPTPEPETETGGDGEEEVGAPVETADLTEGQRKALALLGQMEHMNLDFKSMLDAEPPKTTEFMDKEAQFRSLREQLHKLILDDDSVSEPEFSFIVDDSKKAVGEFVQLRNRAYGTDLGDWEQIEHRP